VSGLADVHSVHRVMFSTRWESRRIGIENATRRSRLWLRMVNVARDTRMLALWRPVVIARPNRTRKVQGQLNFSCCFARCTKNIAKGSGGAMDKAGIVVLNRFKRVFIILLLTTRRNYKPCMCICKQVGLVTVIIQSCSPLLCNPHEYFF